ncbi:MAG TPA: sigma-54-dependent Fis family transcriptional regulator, partial [Planctomycetes bacterium]|nr:sigma-54-dependent Fis family transcriptional regulator [Planctomycetota bacterium]
VPRVDPRVIDVLQTYPWPGNVRELQNYVERAIVLCRGAQLTIDLFPDHVRGLAHVRFRRADRADLDTLCEQFVAQGLAEAERTGRDPHSFVVGLAERRLIQVVLKLCQGVQTKAATRLGINRNTLHKKIAEFGLNDQTR